MTDSVINVKVLQGIKSDHYAQIVEVDINVNCVITTSRCIRKVTDLKFASLKQNLSTLLQRPQYFIDYKTYFEYFIKNIDEVIPVTNVKSKNNNNFHTWATKGILISRERLFNLYALLKENENESLRMLVTNYSKIFKKVCMESKKMHLTKKIEKADNKIKCVWQIIKEQTGKKTNCETNCDKILNCNNDFIYENNEICNFFNNYFVNVAVDLTHNLKCSTAESQLYLNQFISQQPDYFNLKPIDLMRVIKLIRAMKPKQSSDYWYITPVILKKLEFELSVPLMNIINECIEQGYFPDQMKMAKVVPIHKKGSTTLCDNYRPISILPSFSKIFEKYIAEELMDFMIDKQLLSNRQFGFQKAKSTKHAITRLIEDVFLGLEGKQKTYGVFCDLSKAFDCVSHEILLGKLLHYGVNGNELNILKSYLSNRFQVTELNGLRSEKCKINLGVPQGSILGPLLFIIYINDLSVVLKDIDITLFADDTSLIIKNKNSKVISSKLKESILGIKEWFSVNNMLLNVDKTNVIEFALGSRSDKITPECIQEVFNDFNISLSNNVKFLGVRLDTKLTWATHIDEVAKKLCSATYAIKKIKELGGEKAARDVYFAYFHSIMTYGILFWGTAADANRVFILQKRAVRYILGLKQMDSCRQRFKELSIMTMIGEFIFQNLMHVRENLGTIKTKTDLHNVNTRNKARLVVPMTRLAKVSKSYYCTAIRLYNKIPVDIRNMSDSSFKPLVRNQLIDKSYYKIDEAFADSEMFMLPI